MCPAIRGYDGDDPGRDVRMGMDAQCAAPVFRLRALDVGKRRMDGLVAQPAGGADLRAADGGPCPCPFVEVNRLSGLPRLPTCSSRPTRFQSMRYKVVRS